MNTTLILQNIAVLHSAINPDWIDGHPGQPGQLLSPAIADYIVAGLLRDISVNIHDRELATTLHLTGRDLVSAAAQGLASDWDMDDQGRPIHPKPWWVLLLGGKRGLFSDSDGDELDPNRPKVPHWSSLVDKLQGDDLFALSHLVRRLSGPSPEPWLEHVTPAMNDIVLAQGLRQLASLTTSAKASDAIKQAGEAIMKNASARLFDEYCGTAVKHYVPKPGPKVTAA